MHPVFEKYFTILLNMFEYDMEVMSKPWMIYTIIPIVGYFIFFLFKWAALTTPFWMPFALIIGAHKAGKKKDKENQ
jgi:hypothetical protein